MSRPPGPPRRVPALIPTASRLHAEVLASFFKIPGEAVVPAEHAREKLIGIAEDYRRLLVQVTSVPGDDPGIGRLKGEAEEALIGGDLDRADKLLADAHEVQDEIADGRAPEAKAGLGRMLVALAERWVGAAELGEEVASYEAALAVFDKACAYHDAKSAR